MSECGRGREDFFWESCRGRGRVRIECGFYPGKRWRSGRDWQRDVFKVLNG